MLTTDAIERELASRTREVADMSATARAIVDFQQLILEKQGRTR